ncbi:hypothetical protein [Roseovarius sp.]|uniref:hypothetical protein n=1 Tax=Roseovarius sp. TaxID=1486281 RepID=UPI0035657444
MIPTTPKQSFHDIVSRAQSIEAKSGYTIDPTDDRWELKGGWIDFSTLDDVATPVFRAEIKQRFVSLVEARHLSDATLVQFFYAVRDSLRAAFVSMGTPASDLSDEIIEAWRHEPSGIGYPIFLKVFVDNVRSQDRKAFPSLSKAMLNRLKNSKNEDSHVLTLDPKHGPWLQSEVAIQDTAIDKAYVSGHWHPEKYVLVQLLRTFGMRIESLAIMKVSDLKLPMLGDLVAEVRWPFRKNDKPVEQAMLHALPDALRYALEDYLGLRLAGIPARAWPTLPLFTPEGLPGAFQTSIDPARRGQPIKEGPYQGHAKASVLRTRFTTAMKGLNLTTARSGVEEPMHFTSRRERHTIGTRLALKGFSAVHIAAFLGHTNELSCTAYVDLAVICFQLREPRFFHLMDKIGAIYTNPLVSQEEINASYDIVISKEATFNTGSLAVVGGGTCAGCSFAGSSSDVEAWPCLTCPRFHIYEDADLQPLWDIIQERKAGLMNPDGTWNSRFDPDILATLQRYETLLIGAEMHRRTLLEAHDCLPETT